MTIEYDYLISGEQTNHYADGGAKIISSSGGIFVIDSMEFDQDKGFGLRGSVKFTKEGKSFNYFMEPYFRYWKIRDSETRQFTSNGGRTRWFVGGTGFTVPILSNQPKNETTEIGLKVGLKY